jgi:hypothetical protein
MVGDEILDDNLANETILVGYFERKLIELGYSIRRDDAFQMPDDWVARWVLAPGSN